MKRWTVEEYHQLIQAGVFARDNRFELLEGWIVPKMSRNPPHDASMELTRGEVSHRLPRGWHIRQQSAITLVDGSEPGPDLAIVRRGHGTRKYSTAHPGVGNIAIVIEVADSSLAEDRKIKHRLYARAGIGEYWIINLIDAQVEVYADPTGASGAPEYRSRRDFKVGESVPLNVGDLPVAPIPVANLLP